MPLIPPVPEPVPFDEIEAALDAAMARMRGGPMAAVLVSGRHLAASLEAAGYLVVRAAPGRQFTL